LITDRSPVLIAYIGSDRTFKYVNKPYAERFGLRQQDIVGRTVREVIGDEAYAVIEHYIDAVFRGERVEFEMELALRGIGARHMWVTYEPEFEELGQVAGYVATILDITNRKQAEEMISIEKRFSDLIVNSLPGIFYLINERGQFLRWNKALEEVSGYSSEEISKMSPLDFFGGVDKPLIAARIQQVFSYGEVTAEAHFVTKRGGKIPYFFTGKRIEFDGNPCLVGMGIDVTQRYQAEMAQSYLAAIVESSEDAVFAFNLGGFITSWNAGAERLFGYTSAEVVGRPACILIPPGHSEMEEPPKILSHIGQWERATQYETVRTRKDGELISVSLTVSPIKDKSGRIIGVSNIVRDITERKRAESELRESEAHFRGLADAMPQLVWTASPDGTIEYYNSRVRQFNGFTSSADGAWDWQPVVHEDDLRETVNCWEAAVRSGDIFECEHRIKLADGSFRWFLSRAMPLRNDAGEVVRWFGTATDIHDLRKTEQELRENDRRKDEFLAMLAHELRNPLAPIYNATQALKRVGGPDPQVRQLRDMIERQVKYMSRLVDDLLDVSRITRNKITLRKENLEMLTVVGRAVETSRPLIDARKHHLNVSFPHDPVLVEGDLTRLSQVISNLLDNAAKYTEEGGNIWLSVENEGSQVVIRVKDDGVGIPPHILPHVFDLFTQADRTLDRSQGGLGIGLTLVRRLVELHGGRVEARSSGHGMGSEFVIYLPAATRAESNLEVPAPVAGVTSVNRCRILVVDDNVDAAETIAFLLKFDGHDVRVAHDGLAAVESALAFRPQAILLDIGLPGLDGYEVARRLRRLDETKDMILIALTGYGRNEDRVRALTSGFNYHITKPVDPVEVELVIKNLATNRSDESTENARRSDDQDLSQFNVGPERLDRKSACESGEI